MKSYASVEINRPVKEVFEFTIQHVKEWSSMVVEDEPLVEGEPLKVGSQFLCVTEENGQRMEFQGVVTQHEELKAHTSMMRGKVFDIEAQYLFETLGSASTRVTQHANVTGKGFLKLLFGLMGWLMQKQGCQQAQKELENLKRVMESHSTPE